MRSTSFRSSSVGIAPSGEAAALSSAESMCCSSDARNHRAEREPTPHVCMVLAPNVHVYRTLYVRAARSSTPWDTPTGLAAIRWWSVSSEPVPSREALESQARRLLELA